MLTFNIYIDGYRAFRMAITDSEDNFFERNFKQFVDTEKDASRAAPARDAILLGTKTFAKEADMLIYKMKHAGVVTMERVS